MISNNEKQRILLIDDDNVVHKFKSVAEMNDFIVNENQVRERLFISPLKCENVRVFVGEERCLNLVPGHPSTQYQLSGAGCDCNQRGDHA